MLGVGRLTAQKAFDVLIEAFAQVRKSQPARLLILGEGEERPMLEALIRQLGLEQDVDLPGFVSNPYPYMAHAALFVLSSRWEGLPTVLVEAMSLRNTGHCHRLSQWTTGNPKEWSIWSACAGG